MTITQMVTMNKIANIKIYKGSSKNVPLQTHTKSSISTFAIATSQQWAEFKARNQKVLSQILDG